MASGHASHIPTQPGHEIKENPRREESQHGYDLPDRARKWQQKLIGLHAEGACGHGRKGDDGAPSAP